jgi:hypothetical protein
MTQNTANVAAFSPPVGGGVSWAPLGTAIPTDASTALAAAFKPFGYVSGDGVQYSGDAPSTDDQTAWGGDVVATLATTKKVVRYTIKFLEIFNEEVLDMIFGEGNVTVVPASGATPTKITVLDPFTHSALTGYEVQVTGLPDPSGNSRYIYDDLNDAPGA